MVRRLLLTRAWVQALAVAFVAIAAAYPSEPSAMPQLVNNPILSYSTFWGGNGYDAANAIAVDDAGNVYITGQTNSVDFPVTNRALPAGGGSCASSLDGLPYFDVFVTKFSATGSVVYSVYFGGCEDDRGTGIVVDSAGSAYVTGITNSTDFPTATPFQADLAGGNCGASASPVHCYDAFVTKLSPDGASIIYSTYLGGSGQDLAAGIALDRLGEATVVGSTFSPNFPTSRGALQGAYAGGTLDAFVTRLDPTGTNVVYSTYLGGTGEDRGLGIVVNAAGDAIVAGSTSSNDFPAVNGIQMRNAGGSCGSPTSPTACTDAFVARLDAAGTSILYSTYLGGTGGDTANAIALDSVGAVYVAGSTTSTNLPTTSASLQTTGGGVSVDVFVAKLVPDGSPPVYSTYLGGLGQEAAYAMAVDSFGNALVTGYANDPAFPLASPIPDSGGKFHDVFVSKLNAAGSGLIFSSTLGGSGYEA
ncbi:MAG TPA: SBBP repeat-containing protein, partial [Terriglobia bacterium]|nr:SBBP repeat-containing protein [Terriglobia bacterium]